MRCGPTTCCACLQVDSRVVWQQRLAEVDDDMETKLLRAQKAELPFTLQVPDKASGTRRACDKWALLGWAGLGRGMACIPREAG